MYDLDAATMLQHLGQQRCTLEQAQHSTAQHSTAHRSKARRLTLQDLLSQVCHSRGLICAPQVAPQGMQPPLVPAHNTTDFKTQTIHYDLNA